MQVTFRRLSLVLLPLCCAACSAERSGLAGLRRLCDKDAGVSVNGTVTVRGYYDDEKGEGSLRVLLGKNFDYVEFCNERPNRSSLLQEPGCGRYTRRPRGSQLCDPRINAMLDESVIEPYTSFRKDYCVQLELLQEPEARYGLHSDFRSWKHANGSSRFTRADVSVVDGQTDHVLARYVNYTFDLRPGSSIAKDCRIFQGQYPSYREANLVGSVIRPY